jgi:hypothetical protein
VNEGLPVVAKKCACNCDSCLILRCRAGCCGVMVVMVVQNRDVAAVSLRTCLPRVCR